jgi:hypothetical protein
MSKGKMLDRQQSGLVKLASPNHAGDDKQRRKYQIGIRAYRNRRRAAIRDGAFPAWGGPVPTPEPHFDPDDQMVIVSKIHV